MEIRTYLNYEDCYKWIYHKDVFHSYLPISSLDSQGFVDEEIVKLLKTLNKNEVVAFCSFVNMVIQTRSYEELDKFSNELLQSIGTKGIFDKKGPFHRDNLLYFMGLAVQRAKSSEVGMCWFETNPKKIEVNASHAFFEQPENAAMEWTDRIK